MINLIKVPLRFLFRLLCRFELEGIENYHAAGDRVLIVVNHTSLLDVPLLYFFLPDVPTFAINTEISKKWYFKPFFGLADMFVLDPQNPHSLKSLIKFLTIPNKAVIFPEGRITVTGGLMKIYDGPGMVASKSAATVLPIGIEGAQFSKLSYLRGLSRLSFFPRLKMIIHPPVKIETTIETTDENGNTKRNSATQQMTNIMLDIALKNTNTNRTLFRAILDAMRIHGGRRVIADDINLQPVRYRQLITRSFVLGKKISQGTEIGEAVGVLLPNSTTSLVTVLGLQCYARVPALLNFSAGPRPLTVACETALVKRVYTSRIFIEKAELQSSIEALEKIVEIIYLEDLAEHISIFDKFTGLLKGRFPNIAYGLCAANVKPDQRAVILFTSGSEGVPKGVVLSHKNILSNYAQGHIFLPLNKHDLILNFLPMFHSFGFTAGTIFPLLDGSKIFFYPSPLHYRVIPELCYQLNATVIFGTNTFLAAYAKYANPADLLSLRVVVAGAEKLQDDTRKLWVDKFGIRIFEGYGATETAPIISINTPYFYKAGSVGRLLPGMQYYLEPIKGLEIGGRLVVSGPNVMKGYLFHGNDGDIVPPQTDRGLGWYDTGDIVTVDDLNYISIQGRAKRFAKIAGEMVSLTRVEDLAKSIWPNQTHAATVIADKKKGEQINLITDYADADRKQLIAQVKREGNTELIIPRKIIIVDTIPVLGTGKLDYAAISEIANETADL